MYSNIFIMKVYIHLLIIVICSLMIVSCTWNKNRLEYTIEGSGWTGWATTTSGSLSLQDSENIAYINQLSGSVMLDGRVAIRGDILHQDSMLTTGTGTEVEMIFADSSIVRLSSHSRLRISQRWRENTLLDLQEWLLWVRILSPFTDTSFFTLETDDLSAGVRGTSVWLLTDSGWTEIGVVDSIAPPGKLAWIDIDLRENATTGNRALHLSTEEVLRVKHTKPIDRKKMTLREQMQIHPFVGINTIRDIRYMHTLMGTGATQTGTMDRLHREMDTTMPNPDEVNVFLLDPFIRSIVQDSKQRDMSPDQFLYYLDFDTRIQNIQKSDMQDREKNAAIEEVRKLLPKNIEPLPMPIKTPVQITPTSRIVTPSTTSSEKVIITNMIPCVPTVSGEPCR